MEVTRTTVHNHPGKKNKTVVKIDQPRGSLRGGGGGVGFGVGIIILGGAVAAAAFIFNQRRRKSSSSNNGKKGPQSDSAQPVKIIQDKYINEDEGLQFVAVVSSASSDKDQDHQHLRNETSSNGMHDQKQNGHTMVSDETSFFKQDEKGKGKLEVNGINEDTLSNSPQVLDCSPDPSLRGREIQTPVPDEGKTLLQPTIQENEQAMQDITCVRVNGQYIQVNIRGEETNVNSWESKERSPCIGDLLPPISEIEEEVSFQPMSANISMSNGCEENALEIHVAVLVNNDEDEDLEAADEEEGKGQEDIQCTKSSAENGDNEIHFRDRSNEIQNEALKVTDKFQVPKEEANLNHLLISEAPGVAEEVIVCSEAEGKEETVMTDERIQETREKAELPNVDPQESQMDTAETGLVEGFQDDNSDTDEPTSMESNANVPEFDGDNGFKPIQPSAEIGALEKENVDSEAGFEGRVEEIEDSPIQLNDDRKTLKEAEDAVITEEQKLTTQEEDGNDDMDESSASEKVEESLEGTADSLAESNAEPISPAETIQCLPTELEEMEANDSKEIVELPNEEESVEKLDEISTQEKGLQNWNEEKGNLKLTVLERYVVQLQELALEATHPQKRRVLVMTIMASSGSFCLYFGMDFLHICLIFILSMMLFEMQGI